jgi:ribosomal protein L32
LSGNPTSTASRNILAILWKKDIGGVMFCSNCGAKRGPGNFCSSCGSKFEEAAVKAKPKSSTASKAYPSGSEAVGKNLPYIPVTSEPLSQGVKKGLGIAAAILAVLIFIGIVASSSNVQQMAKTEAVASASAAAQEEADAQAARDAAAEVVRQQKQLKQADTQACISVKAYVGEHSPSSVSSYQEGALVLSDISAQIRNLVAGTKFVQAAGIAYANALADAATGLQAGLPLTATGKGVIDQTRINFDNACKAL